MNNKGYGIVCEYNPFHTGHLYQLRRVKELGAPFVVCAMSGNFVQRAQGSFQDKYVRAQNAVRAGADIVLEIPFPFSSMSAEGFCTAGVDILAKSGLCSSFCFGSESEDVQTLTKIALMSEDESFIKSVREIQKADKSISFARARTIAAGQVLGKEAALLLEKPNDILGIEYIKANLRLPQQKRMSYIAIKRTLDRDKTDERYASSSYIRRSFLQDGKEEMCSRYIPSTSDMSVVFAHNSEFEKAIHISLMTKKPKDLEDIAEVSGGCQHSIIKNALQAQSYDELCCLLKAKSLTDAKIRRMLLFSFFGVSKTMAKEKAAFTNVLAISELGGKKLKEFAQDREIVVASKYADVKQDKTAQRQAEFSLVCEKVLEKCRN